jgi:hypothetical protein
MWGWKAVERKIDPSVSLEQAREIIKEAGFKEYVVNPEYIIFKQTGTQLTIKGEELPIEVVIGSAGSGIFLQARYDTFVLFDSGDLAKLADELVSKLSV